jgi:hypothetical protein
MNAGERMRLIGMLIAAAASAAALAVLALVEPKQAAAGWLIATRSVPPDFGLTAGVVVVVFVEEPHAARIAPSSGADMPIMLPRRRNVRRSM